jgi:hypothetical protein
MIAGAVIAANRKLASPPQPGRLKTEMTDNPNAAKAHERMAGTSFRINDQSLLVSSGKIRVAWHSWTGFVAQIAGAVRQGWDARRVARDSRWIPYTAQLQQADLKAFLSPANQTARISVQREFLGCDLPAQEVLGPGFFGVPLLLLLGTKGNPAELPRSKTKAPPTCQVMGALPNSSPPGARSGPDFAGLIQDRQLAKLTAMPCGIPKYVSYVGDIAGNTAKWALQESSLRERPVARRA